MLTMATLDGAHVAGLEERTGSLTPGKQADVVVIDGTAPGTAPVIDPVATVVLCADTVERRHRDHRRRDPQAGREADRRLGRRRGRRSRPRAPTCATRWRRSSRRPRHRELPSPRPQGRRDRPRRPCGSQPPTGFRRCVVVDEDTPGAVHTGFAICELAAGGAHPRARPQLRGQPVRAGGRAGRRHRRRRASGCVPATTASCADRRAARAPQRVGRAGPVGQMLAPQPRAARRRRHVSGAGAPRARPDRRSTSAIRGRGRSATSTRRTWRSTSRRRTCWPSRPACAPRCSSTAGSR